MQQPETNRIWAIQLDRDGHTSWQRLSYTTIRQTGHLFCPAFEDIKQELLGSRDCLHVSLCAAETEDESLVELLAISQSPTYGAGHCWRGHPDISLPALIVAHRSARLRCFDTITHPEPYLEKCELLCMAQLGLHIKVSTAQSSGAAPDMQAAAAAAAATDAQHMHVALTALQPTTLQNHPPRRTSKKS